jgi:hypothetical protein
MTRPEYVEFLGGALGNATRVSRDGAVHFVCCDWRQVTEIMEAGRLAYCETLNIVVWVKSNAGQGSFYRSQHEFVVVFRAGEAAHLNNVELGRHGRSHSNVWNYRGVNTFGAGRMEDHIRRSSPSRLLPMRCATVRGVATFAGILFRAQGRPLPGQRRYVAHRQRRSDADRLDTVVDPVKRHSLSPRLLRNAGRV